VNVLLAEDNPVNQEVAVGLLETLDCMVTVAENGKEAVEAAASGPFDIVLMDCQMPIMDGLEATRAIRKANSDQANRLPIVALTANGLDEGKKACLDAGMDDWLGKPFRREDLKVLLDRWCKAVSSEISSAPIESQVSEQAVLDPGPLEVLRSLDPTGEKDIIRRAIEKFAVYGDDLVDQLAMHVFEQDASEVSRLAHSLKSSSANLGADELSRLAAKLEDATRNGGLPPDIDDHVATLDACYQASRKALFKLIGR